MRLLSFLNQVEATLLLLRPEDATGWRRRVNPGTGEATAWHPRLNLSLRIRASAVGEERHGVNARWIGPTGEVIEERTFFCGTAPFEWQNAAEALAELMPAGAIAPFPAADEQPLAAQS